MPFDIIALILRHIGPQREPEYNVASVCLGLTCSKFYALCRPCWSYITDDWADWVDHGPFSTYLLRENGGYVPLYDLIETWMGPQYRFSFLGNRRGGCFLNLAIYSKDSHFNYQLRDDLKLRWEDFYSYGALIQWRGVHPPPLSSPFGVGEPWWNLMHSIMVSDMENHRYFADWKLRWSEFNCYKKRNLSRNGKMELCGTFFVERTYEYFSHAAAWLGL